MGIIQFHAIADANEFNDAQKGTVIGRWYGLPVKRESTDSNAVIDARYLKVREVLNKKT
jgi:hypothetical protein